MIIKCTYVPPSILEGHTYDPTTVLDTMRFSNLFLQQLTSIQLHFFHRLSILGNENIFTGLDAFTKFLKTEFSEENIEFWIACEDYKKSKTAHELLPKAKTIYETFIQKDAPKEVNLDFQTKEVTSQNIEQPIITTFDAAQNTVYRLMEQDSYPRFLRSDPYLNLVKGRNPTGVNEWKAKLHALLPGQSSVAGD
uniref:Regulator of G protein signaling 18 n=1 Tax=Accipiter nisus TaxID=211598 RepID=A0A8B9NIC3_9AVES